jgi:hypothetical protein
MKKGKILGRYERKLRVFPKITLQTSKACLTRQRTVQINGALDPYGRLWSSRWAVFIATLPMFLVKLWPKPLKNTFKDTVTFLGGSATRKNKQQPEDRKGDTLNSCKKQTTYRDPSKSLRPQFGGFLTEPKAALHASSRNYFPLRRTEGLPWEAETSAVLKDFDPISSHIHI